MQVLSFDVFSNHVFPRCMNVMRIVEAERLSLTDAISERDHRWPCTDAQECPQAILTSPTIWPHALKVDSRGSAPLSPGFPWVKPGSLFRLILQRMPFFRAVNWKLYIL